jgi:hypothetical protein
VLALSNEVCSCSCASSSAQCFRTHPCLNAAMSSTECALSFRVTCESSCKVGPFSAVQRNDSQPTTDRHSPPKAGRAAFMWRYNSEIAKLYIYSPLAPNHHSLTEIDKPRHSPDKLVFYVRLCQTMHCQQSPTWGVLALLFAAAVSTTALSPAPPSFKVTRVLKRSQLLSCCNTHGPHVWFCVIPELYKYTYSRGFTWAGEKGQYQPNK